MTLNDDPKLTAFALGELSDAERQALEAQLDDDARHEIAEIETLGALLSAGLAAEPLPALDPAQREAIEAAARPARPRKAAGGGEPAGRVLRFPRWGAPLAGAAGLLLVAGLAVSVTGLRSARESAMVSERAPSGSEVGFAHDDLATAQILVDQERMHRTPTLKTAERQPAASSPPIGSTSTGEQKLYFSSSTTAEPEPAPRTTQQPAPPENGFVRVDVAQDPESALSTFSIDVDTASYANLRSYLTRGALPPASMVRIEELINYFRYDDAPPTDDQPFACRAEVAGCPWDAHSRLVRIGLKGREIQRAQRPASNLVFLLDVSGSMSQPNKLPLLKQGLELLVAQLDGRDRVSIVVYAGASGVVLPPTSGEQRGAILDAFARLNAGGSTNGGAGIELAYRLAQENFVEGGANRVILATDGDFNVGTTSQQALQQLIEQKAKGGVFLSVLGFGMSGHGDGTMETLADKGNGNYGYVDTLREAHKLLVEDMTGTLVTIAKDVKIQVDFNHHKVESYRLIGYENRMLAAQDFLDDSKDAGEIGAGHTVTALYEVKLRGEGVIPSRYQDTPAADPQLSQAAQQELLTVRLNYKRPDSDQGQGADGILEVPVRDAGLDFEQASDDLRFAAAVAGFGQILRDSAHQGSLRLEGVQRIAQQSLGDDAQGYRGEFLELVAKARQITGDQR